MDASEEESGAARAPKPQDKRRLDRKRVHWRALVLQNAGEKLPGHVADVSEGGMRLVSRYTFRVGGLLNIVIFVPDARNYGKYLTTQVVGKVTYQVMHNDEVQTGMSFENLSVTALQAIRAAMQLNY